MIDFSSTPPVAAFNPQATGHLANYRRVYAASEARVDRPADPAAALTAYLAAYDALGARAVVVKARDVETSFGLKIHNEDVAAFCKAHGPRFIGFAGVDPHKGMAAVRELEHAVTGLGLVGLNIQCFESKLAIDDARLYPLYAKCIELDIPVNIHTGLNFSTRSTMSHGHPGALDTVMTHFPELRVIASPPGWPWVNELIAVAWRHKNVHIGLVAVRPKVLAIPGSGYEPLLQYGNTLLQDRIVFGSAWPMQPVAEAVGEIEALPLKDGVKRKWLGENAAGFLRLA
ncbi:MAG: amidohydrolase family protein [Rhizobiales bacterium]|nr:amidohydrolase family protein [Hyphomicrobiales bacterium]